MLGRGRHNPASSYLHNYNGQEPDTLISPQKGKEGKKLPATRAVTTGVGRAVEGRAGWRFLQTNDLPDSHSGHLGRLGFPVSSGHLPPTSPRRRSADRAPVRTLYPQPTRLLHLPRAPGSLADAVAEVAGALAGLGARVGGKPRSHPEQAALCRGTAAPRRPLPQRAGTDSRLHQCARRVRVRARGGAGLGAVGAGEG